MRFHELAQADPTIAHPPNDRMHHELAPQALPRTRAPHARSGAHSLRATAEAIVTAGIAISTTKAVQVSAVAPGWE
jgi:hypothetical protein